MQWHDAKETNLISNGKLHTSVHGNDDDDDEEDNDGGHFLHIWQTFLGIVIVHDIQCNREQLFEFEDPNLN